MNPDHSSLDEAVNQIAELRPLGAVATQIINITESDRFSAHELATVISSDQALTAKMLRLANSAYYGFPRRITTVRDAVVLLGFRAVRSATLASCVIDANPGSNYLDYREFWQFSVTVGMLAEILGRAERQHQDEAFTAGVLHNIGRLALDQHYPQAMAAALHLARRQEMPLADAERDVIGWTSGDLGGALALHWNLPEPLAEAVALQQAVLADIPDQRSLAAFVVRARLFARAYGLSDGADTPRHSEPPREWTVPPVSVALRRAGGFDGVMERVGVFLETALTR